MSKFNFIGQHKKMRDDSQETYEILATRDWLLNTKEVELLKNMSVFNQYVRNGLRSRVDWKNGNRIYWERFVEKWDTTADSISSKAASNFLLGILPKKEKSVEIYYDNLHQFLESSQEQNTAQSFILQLNAAERDLNHMLHNVLERNNFFEELAYCIRDYLDYGNAVFYYHSFLDTDTGLPAYKFKHMDFNKMFFYTFDEKLYALHTEKEYSFLLEKKYPEWKGAISIPSDSKATIERLFLEQEDGSFLEQVIIDNEVITTFKHAVKPIYIARIGKMANGYGWGDGLTAVGAIVGINFYANSSYIATQKIHKPPLALLDGTTTKTKVKSDVVSYGPGDVTLLSNTSVGLPSIGIANMMQPLTNPSNELSAFLALYQECIKAVMDCYRASLMSSNMEIPNETARAAIARITQMQRDFLSRSEAFLSCILKPIVLEITKILASNLREMLTQLIYQMGGEGGDQIITELMKPEIKIQSFAEESDRQTKILELSQEIQLKAQIAQLPPEMSAEFLQKAKDLWI